MEGKVHPDVQLGLSYNVIDNGFVHYGIYEVGEEQEVPKGMIEIREPEWTYVMTTHSKGEGVEKTYTDLHQWLFDSEYTALEKLV